MKRNLILPIFVVLAVLSACTQSKVPQLGKDPVSKVVAAMSLEQKAFFVTGTGMSVAGRENDTTEVPGAPVVGEVKGIVPGAAGTTYEIPELGIPAIVLADGPAGLRIQPKRENDPETYYCTAFPVATLLASSWDAELVSEVGKAMGTEVLEYGVDIQLAPGMNIHRNPLCGRNFEYYSEDPFLSGKMAAAMVKGVESKGVGTSIKHYVANNAETNRNALNTIVSERAMREIYLEGFRIAVQEAQPWTIMSSYNLVNDVYVCESYDLITKVLRDDWGFEGFVMTDWFGGRDAVAQMRAGNDLLMPGTVPSAKAIIQAVKDGSLEESVLDKNVERILNVILESPKFKGYAYSNKPDLKAHAEIARRVAAEGMVLLKNETKTLPLADAVKNIAVFGNTSLEIVTGGTGSGDVNEAYSISLVEGLEGAGYAVNSELLDVYKKYIEEEDKNRPAAAQFMMRPPIAEMNINPALAQKMAGASDIALITIGRNSGEFMDRKEEGDFTLTKAEKDLVSVVTKAFHAAGKKCVVVLNIGGVIETASWKNLPDAILLAWQPGQEAGNAIADVISGKVNPSGKLVSSFPIAYKDAASADGFPGKPVGGEEAKVGGMDAFNHPQDSKIVYNDGIYVGYRYYATFGVNTSYEFGYGLSYTDFEFSNIRLSAESFADEMTVTVDVKNTGSVAGKEVVQLYLSAPVKELDKPAIELKGFAKTSLLQPGETQTLSFTLSPRSLASYNPEISAWKADAGTYEVKVGASSKDIRLKAGFELANDLEVKKVSVVLTPNEEISELKPSK